MTFVADWVSQNCDTVGIGDLNLGTATDGGVTFAQAFNNGESIMYSVIDGNNKESGVGVLTNANTLTRNPTATLYEGDYNDNPLSPISLSGESIVRCTLVAYEYQKVDYHLFDTSNPHVTTAAQTGADPAGSAAAVQSNLDTHESDFTNPHNVTAAQTGADPVGSAAAVQSNLDSHEGDFTNPHNVTAVQSGSDPAGSAAAVQSNLTSHENNTSNPHSVTAAQSGADPAGSAAAVQANLTSHENNSSNPHSVTKTQVGLGNADNTADLDKPVSNPQQTEINKRPLGYLNDFTHEAYLDDLNDVTVNSTYNVLQGSTLNMPADFPAGSWGFCTTYIHTNNTTFGTMMLYGMGAGANPTIHFRTKQNNVWLAWVKIV